MVLAEKSKGHSNLFQKKDRFVKSCLFFNILIGSLSEYLCASDGIGASSAHGFKQRHYLRNVQRTIRAN